MLMKEDLDAALMRLVDDYRRHFAVGSILRCFARSVHELRAVGVDAGLPVAAEAMARRRLDARLDAAAGAA